MKWTTDEFTGRRFGKYEVLCRLAIGGMAEIFLGFARSGPFVGRPVVIKRILNEQREDPNALQMLLDEAKLTATLSHPNVAQVLDLETVDDEVLLVIEFIAGANLEELVDAHRGDGIPLGFAITVVREAAQGLGHAHAHTNSRGELVPIIHRDVTPRNVMVDFEGDTKVLDFGIARAKGSERRTQAGMVRGTTAYMSPEQAVGKDLDPRTDLFSLGIIFHELITGQRLFYRGNPGQEMAAVYESEIPLPSKVNRRVPRGLDPVLMRVLERKLERRYQSATEFIRELSLAASTLAWPKERCAELLRQRFDARQKDITALLERIPNRALSTGASEARTSAQPQAQFDEARTILGNRANYPVGTFGEVATDPGRPAVTANPTEAARPSLMGTSGRNAPAVLVPAPVPRIDSGSQPDYDDGPTRILPGGKANASARSGDLARAPDPSRSAEAREMSPVTDAELERASPRAEPIEAVTDPSQVTDGSRGTAARIPLMIAAAGALALGAIGGGYVIRNLQPAPTQQTTLVRLSLSSDRPATARLGQQQLGALPISVLLPSGKHLLQLEDGSGVVRELSVDLPASRPETKLDVTLDSLTRVP